MARQPIERFGRDRNNSEGFRHMCAGKCGLSPDPKSGSDGEIPLDVLDDFYNGVSWRREGLTKLVSDQNLKVSSISNHKFTISCAAGPN
jgi:hypothetical protein